MAPRDLPKFQELNFGDIDAAREAIEDPQLLLEGYFDYRQAAYGIETQHLWLLLGPKGSGKTAVLEHIRLKWALMPDRFFTLWDLSGFPVNDVTAIATGQSKGASRNQSAWEFLLLLRLLSSLSDDDSVWSTDGSLHRFVAGLRTLGFLTSDWVSAVTRWGADAITVDASLLGEDGRMGSLSDERAMNPLELTAYMKDVVATTRGSGQHKIALDGLDSFFFESSDEWASLAGLIQAMNTLNKWFKQHDLSYSFVAAVRSDVFDVLPGPDLNKIKQNAVHLDWNAGGIGRSNGLWNLLTMKAAVGRPRVTDVVSQYLGRETRVWVYPDIPTLILDHTRLLPRDVVAAMKLFQLEYGGSSIVPEENAKRAIKRYCEEYFVGEIFDNLAGILEPKKARSLASFREALRTAPTRVFSFEYVKTELAGELDASEVRQLLKQMFDVGGLGIRNGPHTDFVYRSVGGAGFSPRHDYLLHDALTRAWNRPWS
ncbi:hypothetical protein CFI00_10460 [Nocardioides sp. S5]|uniref:P-loop ATPase, Sll1717 family n=1 Tax=Nocardioides sp. S5 TaxID=2017486 RepID=UPI001A8EE6C7|nr:hypothetical protein [Nocardioides sp. S5]QSR30909.1 hypothetical protein CFI00_10460 [Nocardioides sp. S5]